MPANYADYTVTYTYLGVETTENCYDATLNQFVVAHCTSREMAEQVHIVVKNPDGTVIKELDYSVKEYCDSVLDPDSGDPDSLKALCRATLIYGTEASKFFSELYEDGEYTPVIDESSITADDLPDVPETFNAFSSESACSSLRRMTVSLALASKTALNIYFTLNDNVSINDVTITVDGVAISVDSEGDITLTSMEDGRYRLTIAGISAADLNKAYSIRIADASSYREITYSPLTYAYTYYNDEELGEVCRAFYNYYVTAIAFLNSRN